MGTMSTTPGDPGPNSPIDAGAAALAARVQRSVVAVISNNGAGSGTAWRDDDTIVTNHHVARSDTVRVVSSDGREHEGRVVARRPDHDLAIIRVAGGHFEPVEPGDAMGLRAGTAVFAVGNPWGQRGAVTAGIALARPNRDEYVRADIRLAPGNSGGPLVDGHGHAVGINTMINGGMALAVPGYLVDQMLDDLLGPAVAAPAAEGEVLS